MPHASDASLMPGFTCACSSEAAPAGEPAFACEAGCSLGGSPSVYALVPAAGSGTRMGGGSNKPFIDLDGVPAIVRTLRILCGCPCIAGLVIMARADEVPVMKALLASEFADRLIGISAGGATRQESVAIGLSLLSDWLSRQTGAIPADGNPLVAIHDGARCLVPRAVICRTLRHAAAFAPCAAAVPVKDTIKQAGADGHVERTLDRSRLYAIQTPQVARLAAYQTAFDAAGRSGFVATDDLSVLEAAGMAVDLVPGDERNIKLTTPWDLMIARALLATEKTSALPIEPSPSGSAD